MSEPNSRVPRGQPDARAEAVRRALRRRAFERRPTPRRSIEAIDAIADALDRGPCILDLGCGTGVATRQAALTDPERTYIGIDRSAARLERAPRVMATGSSGPPGAPWPDNAMLLRADIDEILAASRDRGWRFAAAWLLYPNPWPKPAHLGRRFYARGALGDVLTITDELEARTNWSVYAEELRIALDALGVEDVETVRFTAPLRPTTAFELKYAASGQALYRVRARWRASSSAPSPKDAQT